MLGLESSGGKFDQLLKRLREWMLGQGGPQDDKAPKKRGSKMKASEADLILKTSDIRPPKLKGRNRGNAHDLVALREQSPEDRKEVTLDHSGTTPPTDFFHISFSHNIPRTCTRSSCMLTTSPSKHLCNRPEGGRGREGGEGREGEHEPHRPWQVCVYMHDAANRCRVQMSSFTTSYTLSIPHHTTPYHLQP